MSQLRRPDDDSVKPSPARPSVLRRILAGSGNDAMAAGAFAIALWLAFGAEPRFAKIYAGAEQSYGQRMAEVDRGFCEKWGVVPGTRQFSLCAEDLERLRSRDLECRLQHFLSM